MSTFFDPLLAAVGLCDAIDSDALRNHVVATRLQRGLLAKRFQGLQHGLTGASNSSKPSVVLVHL
jgi:hypothetical protein